MILENIEKPSDIKKLKKKELDILAREIRDFLIEKIGQHGYRNQSDAFGDQFVNFCEIYQ